MSKQTIEGPQGALQENKLIALKQGRYISKIGRESRRIIVLYQGLDLYRGGRETRKRLVKIIVREREELKQSLKEYQETIYRNLILARLILERRIGVKDIEANLGKRYLSYSIVNTIGGKCYGRFKYNVTTTRRGVKRSQLVNRGTVQDRAGGAI